MEKLINKTITNLINKKMELNEMIEDILYADLNKILIVDDILKIEKIRKDISNIYKFIEILDKIEIYNENEGVK